VGALKNARQQRREAGPNGVSAVPQYFSLRGIRWTKYRKRPDQVNVTRLAAQDPGAWSLVWRCIKRSRPQLAALLMDPQLAAIQKTFNCEGVVVDFADPPEQETDMFIEAHYIDTRDGANNPFTPPPKVDDYAAWLRDQYAACARKDGDRTVYCGLAQKINALIAEGRRRAQDPKAEQLVVRVIGPHSMALMGMLLEMSGGALVVEVLA